MDKTVMLFNKQELNETKPLSSCPYCKGTDIVKKGEREKKYESVQIYYCKKCNRKFTPNITKNKTFPLRLILDSITLYNRFNTFEEAAEKVSERYGIKLNPKNIANWLNDFEKYIPFKRMRGFIGAKYDKRDILVESKMFHGQIYNFKYHRAKTDLILEESFKHYKFKPLRDFLELVAVECPHQTFMESQKRASEYKNIFNLEQVKIIPKSNSAPMFANFVMQAVTNNKLRHEILQEFMLINDSVTVAAEVLFCWIKTTSFIIEIR